MNKEPASPQAIYEMALKVCTKEELTRLPENSLLSLGGMIGRRLDKAGPPPTVDELEGIKEMQADLWHPALGRVAA
jgi:hypothetical protein